MSNDDDVVGKIMFLNVVDIDEIFSLFDSLSSMYPKIYNTVGKHKFLWYYWKLSRTFDPLYF